MSTVDLQRTGAVWVIVLNRPSRRNAISADLQRELVTVLVAFDADPGARVGVLTGADPAFCAGMDLAELGAGCLGFADHRPNYAEAMRALGKPVIGAINGPAIAGGLELALACDFLIASERAWFADTHAAVGVLPGGGLTVRLAQAVGVRRARQISLTGEYVPAGRACQDGLVSEVVPHDELMPRATALAEKIASADPAMVRGLREAYDRAVNLPAEDALDADAQFSQQAGIPAEHVHGVAAGLIAGGSRRIAADDHG
jgi:enoyl-CoA hydratase/carnithine racemase